MANNQHMKVLERGVTAWNRWRAQNPKILPDLSGADFSEVNLSHVNFNSANLQRAYFKEANLYRANLSMAYAPDAIFWRTNLTKARLVSGEFDAALFQ
jgi:uncharacterized protein YjbI with pentapeptide repeats